MQLPLRAGVRVGPAEPEVIVVCGYDESLAFQVRVSARQDTDHIPHLQRLAAFAHNCEALGIAVDDSSTRRERRETQMLKPLLDVVGRSLKTLAARTPPLPFRRGQPFDIGLQAIDVELGSDFGQRLPLRQSDRLAFRREVAGERRVAHRPFAGARIGGFVTVEDQPGILAVVGQLARQRIGGGLARRRDINDHRLLVLRMAGGGDKAPSWRLPRLRSGVWRGGCIERSAVGFDRFRDRRRELVVCAEHPYGPVRRQGIKCVVHDRLDAVPAPCLGKPCINARALRMHHDQHLAGAERL